MGNKTVSLPVLKCKRCGHSWVPRIERRPVKCPRCKNVRWDKERKSAKGG